MIFVSCADRGKGAAALRRGAGHLPVAWLAGPLTGAFLRRWPSLEIIARWTSSPAATASAPQTVAISNAVADQPVGIKEADEGMSTVGFRQI